MYQLCYQEQIIAEKYLICSLLLSIKSCQCVTHDDILKHGQIAGQPADIRSVTESQNQTG